MNQREDGDSNRTTKECSLSALAACRTSTNLQNEKQHEQGDLQYHVIMCQ